MESKTKTIEDLSSEVVRYLQRLSYSDSRISQYRSAWQRVVVFMESNHLPLYSATVGEAFITDFIGTGEYNTLDRWEKDILRCTNALTKFLETGSLQYRRIEKSRELKGLIGQTMEDFIACRKSLGISKVTIDQYKLNLNRFLNYLNENDITCVNSINRHHIPGFVNLLGFYTPATRHIMLTMLRGYFRHLHEQDLMEIDFSYLIPKDNYKKQPKLPTTYTKDEVEALISAIDRGSPKGKRDYAMVLMAARLGLRSSDICGIMFENLHWDQNLIVLIQQKTKKKIELPLLSEIGGAIIDYLKYGRPNSTLPYIFLHVIPPYSPIKYSTLHSIVCFYLRRANIKHVDERKHGPHALRHSLVGILLEKKTPVTVIAEILGHKNIESTKSYLRVDLASLRQCALEVPILSTPFYEGRAGQ